MFGIDLLTAGSLMVLAASSSNSLCSMPAPTKINVLPKTKDIKYDTSQTMAEIQSYATDTVDPYDFHGMTYTQGFMKGSIKMEPVIKLNYKIYPSYNAMCVWYESIDIKIEIDPTIVIAKEVHDDRCMGKAVIDHEMKHIRVDRQIVNKYAKIMGKKVHEALKERGFMAGPVSAEHGKKIAGRMQKTVFQIVEHEYKKMELERTELQRAVDSLEEYENVSAQCPDYKYKPKSKKSAFISKKR